MAATEKASGLDCFLTLFTEVKAGEGVNALLLALIFLILTAYYILKPVREALILHAIPEHLDRSQEAGRYDPSALRLLDSRQKRGAATTPVVRNRNVLGWVE